MQQIQIWQLKVAINKAKSKQEFKVLKSTLFQLCVESMKIKIQQWNFDWFG